MWPPSLVVQTLWSRNFINVHLFGCVCVCTYVLTDFWPHGLQSFPFWQKCSTKAWNWFITQMMHQMTIQHQHISRFQRHRLWGKEWSSTCLYYWTRMCVYICVWEEGAAGDNMAKALGLWHSGCVEVLSIGSLLCVLLVILQSRGLWLHVGVFLPTT